jgi:hypothetical protein
MVDEQAQRRFVEVGVHVDEAGVDGMATTVEHFIPFGYREVPSAYGLDPPTVVDEDGTSAGGEPLGPAVGDHGVEESLHFPMPFAGCFRRPR